MSITRREFLQILTLAAAYGLPPRASAAAAAEALYDLPRPAGNVTLLHLTDCHAQLKPLHFREPDTNLGLFGARGRPPHLVGQALLKRYRIAPRSRLAHAYTHLDFEEAARHYGRVGGFAHLAALAKRLRAQRPGALLLDGGDSWQGSATALWTRGEDMIACSKLLGVDVMTGHWEFTLGMDRVKEIVEKDFAGKVGESDLSGSMRFQSLPARPYSGARTGSMNPESVFPQFGHYVDTAGAGGIRSTVLLIHSGGRVGVSIRPQSVLESSSVGPVRACDLGRGEHELRSLSYCVGCDFGRGIGLRPKGSKARRCADGL